MQQCPPPSTPPHQAMATARHDQSQSPLFGLLPSELRLAVYTHVLRVDAADDGTVVFAGHATTTTTSTTTTRTSCAAAAAPPPSVLALLQTCRRAHDEALDVFFAVNHLRFGGPFQLFWLARPMPFWFGYRERRPAPRRVTVAVDSVLDLLVVLDHLPLFPNLRSVDIDFGLAAVYSPAVKGDRRLAIPRHAWRLTEMARLLARSNPRLDIAAHVVVAGARLEDHREASRASWLAETHLALVVASAPRLQQDLNDIFDVAFRKESRAVPMLTNEVSH